MLDDVEFYTFIYLLGFLLCTFLNCFYLSLCLIYDFYFVIVQFWLKLCSYPWVLKNLFFTGNSRQVLYRIFVTMGSLFPVGIVGLKQEVMIRGNFSWFRGSLYELWSRLLSPPCFIRTLLIKTSLSFVSF